MFAAACARDVSQEIYEAVKTLEVEGFLQVCTLYSRIKDDASQHFTVSHYSRVQALHADLG